MYRSKYKKPHVGNIVFVVYLLSMIFFGWKIPTIVYLVLVLSALTISWLAFTLAERLEDYEK